MVTVSAKIHKASLWEMDVWHIFCGDSEYMWGPKFDKDNKKKK